MRNYALVIPTVGPINTSCRYAWQLLERNCGLNRISSSSPYPHIAIAGGSTESTEEEVISIWKNQIREDPFILKGNGLGVFLNETATIYVRWPCTKELENIYKAANKLFAPICHFLPLSVRREFWVPKTTLAQFDMSAADLSEVIRILENIDFIDEMRINEFSILEYGEQGERHIMSFNLGISDF